MARYIDADKIPYVQSEDGCLDDFAYRYDINEIPTADVVKVKHGEWKEIKCGDGVFDYCFKCSNCGGTTPPKAFPVAPDYCPFCGSIMDGTLKESEVRGE